MWWFVFALLTALLWGAADLFYKKGTVAEDKYSPMKIVVAVGFVMGLHALVYGLINRVSFTINDVVTYLPVSAMYIISMAIGYKGLRYLDLSVASPVQNASGALVVILLLLVFQAKVTVYDVIAIVLVFAGIIGMGVIEKKEDDYVPLIESDKKYAVSVLAIVFPILYCVIDALGTFGDAVVLEQLKIISEDAALISYELTFFVCAVVCFIILLCKKQKFDFKSDKFKLTAAIFETGGQFFYVFALAGNSVIAVPIVGSYCIFSVIFSRIFLKEKLSPRKLVMVILVIVGIVLMGVSEGLQG